MTTLESNHTLETRAPRLSPKRTCIWGKALAAALVLATATGIGLAQGLDPAPAFLPSPVRSVSTVPSNGDGNPYGVAFVPHNFLAGAGVLTPGDILVSNWNNKKNLQGTGTTIVRVPASGAPPTLFYQGPAGLGLSAALGVLQYGFVVVGNSPTTDGTSNTAKPGSLLVINSAGKLVQTFASSSIQGPWGMALVDQGDRATAYISSDFDGNVVRMDFQVSSAGLKLLDTAVIASGYVDRGDPNTVFVAPTGLVYDSKHDLLYVASTGDNAVFGITNASTRTSSDGQGFIVYLDQAHLHGPLGLTAAPNGNLLVTNNDGVNPDPKQPSEIVEFTKQGEFVKEIPVDPAPGASFGLAVNVNDDNEAIFAAVDDNTNRLIVWTLNLP
jgi:hypothetical protein